MYKEKSGRDIFMDPRISEWFSMMVKITRIDSNRLSRTDAYDSFTTFCNESGSPTYQSRQAFCRQLKVLMDMAGVKSIRHEKAYYVGVRLH